jgi:DNA polymerase-3 subunit epsilon
MKARTALIPQKGSDFRMNNFTAIDFETGTFSPENAISIGLVKYRNYQIIDSYYSLIRPPTLYIRPDFTEIHGLTINDVKDSPDFNYLWEHEIKEFIGTTLLAAHHAAFDTRVLKSVLKWYGIPVPKLKYFCTCIMARHTWPAFESHKLTTLAEQFGITYNAHNALEDAITCGKLVQLAAEKFATGNNITALLKATKTRKKVL